MLRKFKRKQFFWNIAEKVAIFYPLGNFKKPPKEIMVEVTNACNLRCPVCPTHFAMKRQKGFMDFGLFKSIIDDFKNSKKKPKIMMIFAGEPLLHQEIDKFIEYAAKNGHETLISTNTTMLTKDLSRRLIKAGLKCIHVCLEGFTKKSHEEYRRGSNFETVKKNIEDLISVKKELNRKKPTVVIQTLLTSLSENEVDKISEWARDIGADAVNLKTLSLGSHTTIQMKKDFSYLLPKNKELRRKTSKVNKTLCSWPLRNVVVYWNGDLGLCCVDFDNEIKMGNVKEKGFLKLFSSNETAVKRKIGFLKKFDLCKKCSIGNADSLGIEQRLRR